jgi:hypothetical protein
MLKNIAIAAALAATALATPAAAVTLTGLTLQVGHAFPTNSSLDFGPFDFIVGTSAPVNYSSIATMSVGASSFTVNTFCGTGCTWTATTFNGFVLLDTYNVAPAFTSVTINGATSVAGFDASRITFDANTVFLNLQGLDANGLVVVDLNGGSGVVPEPASWAMLIAGFGLVGAAMRRRRTLQAA